MLTCEDLQRIYQDDVLLVTGPPLGPEGSLIERARAGGVPLEIIPALRRAIHPWQDAVSYLALRRRCGGSSPRSSTRIAARPGC